MSEHIGVDLFAVRFLDRARVERPFVLIEECKDAFEGGVRDLDRMACPPSAPMAQI